MKTRSGQDRSASPGTRRSAGTRSQIGGGRHVRAFPSGAVVVAAHPPTPSPPGTPLGAAPVGSGGGCGRWRMKERRPEAAFERDVVGRGHRTPDREADLPVGRARSTRRRSRGAVDARPLARDGVLHLPEDDPPRRGEDRWRRGWAGDRNRPNSGRSASPGPVGAGGEGAEDRVGQEVVVEPASEARHGSASTRRRRSRVSRLVSRRGSVWGNDTCRSGWLSRRCRRRSRGLVPRHRLLDRLEQEQRLDREGHRRQDRAPRQRLLLARGRRPTSPVRVTLEPTGRRGQQRPAGAVGAGRGGPRELGDVPPCCAATGRAARVRR